VGGNFNENQKNIFGPILNRQKLASNYFLGNLTKPPQQNTGKIKI